MERGKRIHGLSPTRTYNVWNLMMQRCKNPKDKMYARYGGRGIRVCEVWHDFLVFLRDMGEAPPGLQIDRINNDGNYEPGNCRWVTRTVNRRNRRDIKVLTISGKTQSIADWVRETGMPASTPYDRVRRDVRESLLLQKGRWV